MRNFATSEKFLKSYLSQNSLVIFLLATGLISIDVNDQLLNKPSGNTGENAMNYFHLNSLSRDRREVWMSFLGLGRYTHVRRSLFLKLASKSGAYTLL